MLKLPCALIIATLGVGIAPLYAQELPSTAKKVSMDEFKKFADGKKVHVEILDFEKPVSAELTWNWKKKKITGEAKLDGSTFPVSSKLSFAGDKACATNKGEKPACHAVFIDGDKFYEVRDDGKLHAVSTLTP